MSNLRACEFDVGGMLREDPAREASRVQVAREEWAATCWVIFRSLIPVLNSIR